MLRQWQCGCSERPAIVKVAVSGAGAAAPAAKTRARARQRVAVGTRCWYEQVRLLLWLRPLMATGSGEADAVKLRAAEAGTGMAQGSGVVETGRVNTK